MCQFPISAHPTDFSQTPRIRLIYLHIPHINTCDTTTHHNAPAMRTTQPAGKSFTLDQFFWRHVVTPRVWGWRTAVSLASFRGNMIFVAARSAFRAGVAAGACGAGSGVARALGGVPASTPPMHRHLGAVAGSSPWGRGFACFRVGGVNGGGGGGVGGGGGGSPPATRGLSSSCGDGGGGSSSLNDKLRAARERRGPPRGGEVGGQAVGGAARGGRGSSGASARGGGRGGGGGRGRGGAGGGMARAIALNGRISQLDNDPEGLLRLVGEEHPNFNDVNVSTVFSKLGRLCGSRSFPRNIAADDSFRGLMKQARAMCADGRLQARELANLTHAVAKMSAAGKLAAADAGLQDVLTALEQRIVLVASDMAPQGVSNTVYAFAVLGRNRITLNPTRCPVETHLTATTSV